MISGEGLGIGADAMSASVIAAMSEVRSNQTCGGYVKVGANDSTQT